MRRSTSFSPARRRCKVSPSSRGLGAWLLLLGEQCPGRFGLERFGEQVPLPELASDGDEEIGRASCRERVLVPGEEDVIQYEDCGAFKEQLVRLRDDN